MITIIFYFIKTILIYFYCLNFSYMQISGNALIAVVLK